ncbi:MAG TPA: TonB-dependent receptor [Chitinophagaceae bacterium]|nr:TonB-dependent receptor [Chitinophagaceae bacterium]
MRKFFYLPFILLFSAFSAVQAQTNTTVIKGNVTDATQKGLESATISLLKSTDSSVLKIAAADKNGSFRFENFGAGSYLVLATAVGYQAGYSEVFEIAIPVADVAVKPIQLAVASKNLTGVTVVAKKAFVEQKVDRMVVNVDASPTNVGSSALEVLEKSPGITVDKDGNISLKGKQGVMVLVDGRPTQLSGTDLANLLRSMNANQLDQIEIMTNPPAKYDAAGNAGIINIKTKKNKQFGYNGTVTLGYSQGVYPKYNSGINFNYRAGKVNLFTNLSENHWESFQHHDIQRKFRNESTKELLYDFDQQARMKNKNNSYNAKLGLDYFASKNTTFGIVFTGLTNPGTFSNRNIIDITDAASLASVTKAHVASGQEFKNFSTNVNFRQVLDTTGRELTADFDYIKYDSKGSQNLSNYYYDYNGNTQQKGDTLYGRLPQMIDILSGKVDYVQPLKKGARFEAGLKTSFVKTDNNANYDSVHNGQIVHDFGRSNYFIYEETINAAYANYNRPLTKKWNMQLGLRVENTLAKGNQKTTGETFNRSYTNLFPTAYFQYAADKKNSFGINYGRRVRRPNYESLNPFIEFIDRYTYEQGNPNLKPQFSHNMELSHTYNNFLTTTLNYTNTTDIIQEVIEQNNATNETYVKRANIASQKQYGIAVNVGKPVTKWWTTNLYVNFSNNQYKGVVNGTPVSLQGNVFMMNGSQQFTLSKKTSAEISGWFRGPGIDGVIAIKSLGAMSVGMSQKILKDKGTLRLNVRDVLGTQHFSAVSKYGNVDAAFQNSFDSRVVNIGFTYRFAKGKVEAKQSRRTGGADDEQSRVGKGGN